MTGSESTRASLAVIGVRGIPANYGGDEICAEETTAYWSRHGIRVLVYCRKSHYHEYAPAPGSIQLKHTNALSVRNLDALTHTFVSILDLLRTERQVEVVHLYNTGNAIFLPLLKLFGKKVMMTAAGHEWQCEKKGLAARLWHELCARMAVRFADEIIVDNVEAQKDYSRRFRRESHLIAGGARQIERDERRSDASGIEENIASTDGAADLRRQGQEFVDEPGRAAAAADRGHDHVAEHYQWNAVAQKYLSLIEELRAQKGRRERKRRPLLARAKPD